jgi:rhodanese-related sulfurtransferase
MSQQNDISVEELSKRIQNGSRPVLVDVREPFEFDIANLEGILIPLGELESRLDELEPHKNEEIVLHCRSGARSGEAVEILKRNGFTNPRNLKGGINEWAKKIDPSLPIY